MKRRKSRAQSFVEYALLIAIVVGALITMRIFTVRAVQEKYRQAADVFGYGQQYAKGVTQVTDDVYPPYKKDPDPCPPNCPPGSPCPKVVAYVKDLENLITNILRTAEEMEKTAASIEAAILTLKQVVVDLRANAELMRGLAQKKRDDAIIKQNEATSKRTEATRLRADADANDILAGQYRLQYPQCFDGTGGDECPDIVSIVKKLEDDAVYWRLEADRLEGEAIILEEEAVKLNNEASSLEADAAAADKTADYIEGTTIPELEAQVAQLKAEAAKLKEEAAKKQAEIDKIKRENPKCFP